jgi:hypothetical protein
MMVFSRSIWTTLQENFSNLFKNIFLTKQDTTIVQDFNGHGNQILRFFLYFYLPTKSCESKRYLKGQL